MWEDGDNKQQEQHSHQRLRFRQQWRKRPTNLVPQFVEAKVEAAGGSMRV